MSSTSKDGLLALCGSFLGLSVISVSLRLYIRKQQRVRLFMDDWFAVLGVVFFVGSCIVTFLFVHYRILGYSSSDFTEAQELAMDRPSGRLGYAFDFANTTTLAAIKLSALFLYRRIFVTGAHPREWFNRVILGIATVVVCWYITFMFLAAFQCPGHWNAVSNGNVAYCTVNWPWALGLAISDFLLDLIVLLLPIPQVWRLQTTSAKKLSIIGVFGLAFVGLGASIARLYFYVKDRGGVFWEHHDFERLYTQIIYIQMLESGISITAVNFPCLWGLCTTRIPERIVASLRSLRSLSSIDVMRTRGRQNSDEGKTTFSVENKSSTGGSAHDVGVESWSSQQPALRGDLEGQTFATHVSHGSEKALARPEFIGERNSIRVERSLEVRHS